MTRSLSSPNHDGVCTVTDRESGSIHENVSTPRSGPRRDQCPL